MDYQVNYLIQHDGMIKIYHIKTISRANVLKTEEIVKYPRACLIYRISTPYYIIVLFKIIQLYSLIQNQKLIQYDL